MGDHQAQEGGHRRPPRQDVRQADQEHRGRRADGRRRPGGNPTLYDAIQKAKKSSVPNDNIDRAVKRGSGAEAGGADYQTIMYEGYGPAGVAMLIECLTDNRNRAAMEVRTAMTRNGGSLADPGSVSFLFNRKGVVIIPVTQESRTVTEDDVLEAALDAGAEEVNDLGESIEVISEATDLVGVRTALQQAGLDYDSAEAEFVPDMEVALDKDAARPRCSWLVDALEDLDDVQNVFSQRRHHRRRHGRARRLSRVECAPAPACRARTRGRQRLALLRTGVRTEGDAMRVLGIDPGLTRCGMGVVEGSVGRPLTMIDVNVLRTSADDPVAIRLVTIEKGIDAWLDEYAPDAVAVERVFARSDVSTVMGTAQASGIAMVAAARRGLPIALHTPSEVKAAVSGSGRADKAQVGAMVTRILRLDAPPKPADAADALALAITHIWRGEAQARIDQAVARQRAALAGSGRTR